ncbi:hypothetical protein Aperf_G00000087645 [Anoplocephala perfoliata]
MPMMDNPSSEPPVKSKAQLKRERRNLQEAQRAKKAAEKAAKQAQLVKSCDGDAPNPQAEAKGNKKSAQSQQEPAQLNQKKQASSLKPIISDKQKNTKKLRFLPTEGQLPQEGKKSTLTGRTSSAASGSGTTGSGQRRTLGVMRMDDPAHLKKALRQLSKKKLPPRPFDPVRISYFLHLSQPDKRISVLDQHRCGAGSMIHLSFQRLGFDIDEGRIRGSDARCLEFVFATFVLIRDFDWSSIPTVYGSLARAFHNHFDRHVTFLDQCRPLAVTVRGAVHCLKTALNRFDSLNTREDLAPELVDALSTFVIEQIHKPSLVIAEHVNQIIRDGSTICVFGFSTVVARSLISAWTKHKRQFEVFIVDARPRCDGLHMLQKLSKVGIPCSIMPISSVPAFASKIDLTLVGAHSLLTSGFAIGAMGTAHVANMIHSTVGTPVMICAETYKFWDRAQSDAFEFNELADPDELWRGERAPTDDWRVPKDPDYVVNPENHPENWRDLSQNNKGRKDLRLLNLTYDVIPPDLISAVITELGVIPASSASGVLNSRQARIEASDGFSIPDFM